MHKLIHTHKEIDTKKSKLIFLKSEALIIQVN
jgi:hypothetical protein